MNRSRSAAPARARAPRPIVVAVVSVALAAAALVAPGAAGTAPAGTPTAASQVSLEQAPYLVGRAVADITGDPEDSDKMGYASLTEKTHGLHQRLRSRSFIVVDRKTGHRAAIVIDDIGLMDDSIRTEVLERLRAELGPVYTRDNLLLTATHTHSSPGGYMHPNAYNLYSLGYRKQNFEAIVAGTTEAIVAAHRDLGPGRLDLGTQQITNASVNRSRSGFDANPAADKAFFPRAIDPQSTTMRLSRGGTAVGAVNWFATHGTSMSRHGTHVSGDNKGYAAYHWEREVEHVDYLDDSSPSFVAGFAQTNAGDMTPNLALQEGTGPTGDHVENTRIIGTRQYAAARRAVERPATEITGPVESRFTYVDMGNTTVRPAYTGDGQTHRTCSGVFGAGFVAGSKEDGPGLEVLYEGEGNNPLVGALSDALYTASPELRRCQAPKDILLPTGPLGLTPDVVPVQLVRIGQLYLVAVPQEFTIVAGLRLRRTIAGIVKAPLHNVLVAGYSNGYAGYVTTPEEYDVGNYEAGHTMFGRWTLPAYQQTMAGLAKDLVAGRPTPVRVEPDLPPVIASPPVPWKDASPPGRAFGDVVQQPAAAYNRGQRVVARFVGANPNNDTRRGGTYLTVERATSGGWQRVHDDGDWCTTFQWVKKAPLGTSDFDITWDIPAGTPTGRYRITYRGTATPLLGTPEQFRGVTRTFTVN